MNGRPALIILVLFASMELASAPVAAASGRASSAAISTAELDDMISNAVESFKAGQATQAVETLQRCIALNKNYPGCQRTLGIVYAKTGHLHRAAAYLRTYLRLQPRAVDTVQVRELVSIYESTNAE